MPTHDLQPFWGFADPVSSGLHLFGAVVFAVLAVPLVRKGMAARHRDGSSAGSGHVASLIIFAVSAVLLLTLSGLFHLLPNATIARDVFQRLDHAAIFVLIAGTMTAVHGVLFRGPWRWGMLAFVWTLAAAGISVKTAYFRSTPEGVGLMAYLAMGWLGLVSIILAARRFGRRLVLPLVLGGLVYTAGALIEWIRPPPLIPGVVRAHEFFHVAVLAGLGLHWWFVWNTASLTTRSGGHLDVHVRRRPMDATSTRVVVRRSPGQRPTQAGPRRSQRG